MAYWRITLPAGLDKATAELLREIPGAKVTGAGIAVPEHGAWLVVEALSALGIAHVLGRPRPRPKKDARLAAPWLKPWVPAFLTHYQRTGVMVALNMPGESGHFWWSAGSGKTLGAIVWALSAGPTITVVVTKAAVRGTWAREIETYTQGVEWRVLEGTKVAPIVGLPFDRPSFLVTGYDTLPDWIETIQKLPVRSVVFDESHILRNPKRWNANVRLPGGETLVEEVPHETAGESPATPLPEPEVTFSLKDNRTAAGYLLSRLARRRLATTATPISDRVRDLWSQLDLVHPWEWGAFYPWARRYCAATENPYGGIDTRGKSNLVELQKRCAFVVNRVPFSVANRDLPPKRRLVTYVKVKEQVRPEAIAAEIRSAMKGVRTGAEGRARLLEVRLMEAASRKRKIVVDHVTDAVAGGLKVVIFTGRRKDVTRLEEDIRSAVPDGTAIFAGDGGTPLGDAMNPAEGTRYWMLDRFMQSKGPAVLVGTGDAWGEGLNIQDTDLAIMAMLPYTPRQIIQWEGRFARQGQKRPVLIRYLICEGTVDEHVATILLKKLPAVEQATQSDEITGLGRELVGASEEELLNSLFAKVIAVSTEEAPK